MTKKELVKALLKKDCFEIFVSNDFDEKKTQSEFYGGLILSFEYQRHKVGLYAVGDVIGYVYHLGEEGCLIEERVKDKNNFGRLRFILDSIGINTDSEVVFEDCYEMPETEIKKKLANHKALVLLDYSNWFEVFIDGKSEIWEDDLSGLSDLISDLDDWINWAES